MNRKTGTLVPVFRFPCKRGVRCRAGGATAGAITSDASPFVVDVCMERAHARTVYHRVAVAPVTVRCLRATCARARARKKICNAGADVLYYTLTHHGVLRFAPKRAEDRRAGVTSDNTPLPCRRGVRGREHTGKIAIGGCRPAAGAFSGK